MGIPKTLYGVAALAVLMAVSPGARSVENQVCIGTEPFWRLDLVGDQARLTTPEAPPRRFTGGFTALDYLGVVAWRGRPSDAVGGDLVAMVEAGECSDGMSDDLFPRRVRVSLPGGVLLAGCCRPVEQVSGRSP